MKGFLYPNANYMIVRIFKFYITLYLHSCMPHARVTSQMMLHLQIREIKCCSEYHKLMSATPRSTD